MGEPSSSLFNQQEGSAATCGNIDEAQSVSDSGLAQTRWAIHRAGVHLRFSQPSSGRLQCGVAYGIRTR